MSTAKKKVCKCIIEEGIVQIYKSEGNKHIISSESVLELVLSTIVEGSKSDLF